MEPFNRMGKTRDILKKISDTKGTVHAKMGTRKDKLFFYIPYYAKAVDCVDHNKLWKILQEMGIPHHLTCLLRDLNVGQEATVRTEHGTRDGIQIGKGVCQYCISSPCLFNLYAEYVM